MADGRWVMTENELNSVVSGFKETDTEALPNEGKHLPVDVRGSSGDACNREMGYNEICAFCGSDKMRVGFGKYGQGFGCRSSKWGSFLGRRETIFLSSIYCYEKRGILWLIYKL